MVSRPNRRAVLSILFYGLVTFVALGCTKSPSVLQDSVVKTIFFSTKDFKFYDLGFVKFYANHISLEIFNAGALLFKMDCYKDKICLNAQCYAKESMMRRLFGSDAFRGLDFIALVKGQEIFSGENKQQTPEGFSQTLIEKGMQLDYIVAKDSIMLHIQDLHKKTIFRLEIY